MNSTKVVTGDGLNQCENILCHKNVKVELNSINLIVARHAQVISAYFAYFGIFGDFFISWPVFYKMFTLLEKNSQNFVTSGKIFYKILTFFPKYFPKF